MPTRSWIRRLFARPTPANSRPGRRGRLSLQPLEARTVPAAPLINPIPDVNLGTGQLVRQIPVTATDPDGQALTFSAQAAANPAYFLATDLGLKDQTVRQPNWGGAGEKWLTGKSGWYFVTPAGELHQWDKTPNRASGPLVATLPPVYYVATDLLTHPRNTDLPAILDKRFGLTASTQPAANTLGLGEKWMTGTGGQKFYITPAGDLFRATGQRQVPLARLGPDYFADVRKLTSPKAGTIPVRMLGSVLSLGEAPAAGAYTVRVTASNGTAAASQTFQVTAGAGSAPVVPDPGPQVLGVGEQTLVVPMASTDADNDPLTYTAHAAGSPAYFLGTGLGLKPGTRPVNWGHAGERWFTSQAGDWYFLKPSGDFYKWDGTDRQASGTQLASLPPAYFYYPGLLTRPSDQSLAFVLDQKLGLSPTAKPAPNALHLNEKWLAGTGGVKFMLTPDGGLYRQAGTNLVWLADLGVTYYAQPNLLYAAARDQFAASIAADGTLTVTTRSNFTGTFVVEVAVSDGTHTVVQDVPVTQSDYVSQAAPRVAGAISNDNTTVLVTFSQPMNNQAVNPANYQLVAADGQGGLRVTGARFADPDRTAVRLTTLSQTATEYLVTVVNVKDLGGTAMAPPTVTGGILVNPSQTTFVGTPPTADDLVDTDGDGLPDVVEQRGWPVTVTFLNGKTATRWVTSDPTRADTDGDGMPDAQEYNLGLDPRNKDTDGDQLTDYQEFNEIFTDPTKQDTDGDGLDDNVEFTFFHTSPLQADTDGDQLPDSAEIISGTHNPLVADLPVPAIKIGDVGLQLDVQFTATSSTGTQQTQSKSVTSTLTQTASDSYSQADSQSREEAIKGGFTFGFKVGSDDSDFHADFNFERDYTKNFTSSFTHDSAVSTEQAAGNSFQTDLQTSSDETVERTVTGAAMNVSVTLSDPGSVAFNLSNVQLSVFFEDPTQPGTLVPIGTLLPTTGAPNSFNLGPLTPAIGPIIFTNPTPQQIFPSVVERLMQNPRGLVFKVSNYDIVDEAGRNFAFTTQDVNDRTAPFTIDAGPAQGGRGGTTKYQVSTSLGRPIADTNGDGTIDGGDRPVVFDPNTGKPVGVTAAQVMQTILGLTHYDEDTTPTASLTPAQLKNSYSTRVVTRTVGQQQVQEERLYRVGAVAEKDDPATGLALGRWVVFTPAGFDLVGNFSDQVVQAGGGMTLKYMQDQDADGIDAATEYLLGSSDTSSDSDGDGLSDTLEYYGKNDPADPNAAWTVKVYTDATHQTVTSSYTAHASPALADTDGDGLPDGYEFQHGTDPEKTDTDGDLLSDAAEINGYHVGFRFPDANHLPAALIQSDPNAPDTDGDGLTDGNEVTLGTNPVYPDAAEGTDTDRDGLTDYEETQFSHTDPHKPDSDSDGLTDAEEVKTLHTDPNNPDTDGDGLTDLQEVSVTANPDGTRTITLKTDPNNPDTDNDGRTDGEEVNVPITVHVAGQAPYQAFSDPLKADTDGDLLTDAQEFAAGTDPTKFDTDGDNPSLGDGRELQLGTNPLAPDQKVSVFIASITETGFTDGGDHDITPHELEFYGNLDLKFTGNSDDAQAWNLKSTDAQGGIDSTNPDIVLTSYGGLTEIVHPGEAFNLYGAFTEVDNVPAENDDFIGPGSVQLAYPFTTTTGTATWTGVNDNQDVSIVVTYRVTVLT